MTGWGGPSDLSGSLWLTHDDQNLYLSAKVTDDVFSQPNRNGNIWARGRSAARHDGRCAG